MAPDRQEKLIELTEQTCRLLCRYRELWDEKLALGVQELSDEKIRQTFHSVYALLDRPAPLVVSVDSPMQLMLMPALLRIRALSDQSTWQMIRDHLTWPKFKETMDALEEKISADDINIILAGRSETNTWLQAVSETETSTRAHSQPLDSIFSRPKGQRLDTRPDFFEALMAELDSRMSALVTAEIRQWVGSECLWTDGGFPGRMINFINPELRAETARLGQLRIAIQNLSNMGTTERAALRIFRERGDFTSLVPEPMIKQGELETQFLEQLGEKTVNILAQALSARNLEPTIYESYPPALESILEGNSSGLWFTGQLAVGFNSMILQPRLEKLPQFTFLLDAGEKNIFGEMTAEAIENLRIFMANRTPICPFAEIVFVSKPPLYMETDDVGRLHSLEKPALAYRDGYCIHSIHGVTVNEKTVTAPENITVQDIESEFNLEVRRIMLDRFGIARFLVESNAEIVSEDGYGTLYRRRMAGDEPLTMVRVKNSTPEPDGSFREYFLRVPPAMRTAKEAVAWTFNIDEDEYQPQQET